jgi:hypothetical protein
MNIADQIKSKFNEISAGQLGGIEGAMVSGEINRKLSSTDMTEEEDCETCDKTETKETTGSGSAGGYSAPLFSKVEANETTSSSSVGMYDAPGFEDVKMKGNHTRGSGRSYKKTQIPGGKFVEVKAKCKKFPYCNQGDMKALKIFEDKKMQDAIKNVSKKMNISESVIKNIIAYEYENRKSK